MSFAVNSFSLPNALVDDYAMAEMSPNALKCYILIVRKTTGWNKTKDKISQTVISDLTGIKDDRTMSAACSELSEKGLIIVHKTRGQMNEYELITSPKAPTNNAGGAKNVPTKNVGTPPTNNAGGVPTIDVGKLPTKNVGLQKTIQKTLTKNNKQKKKSVADTLRSLVENQQIVDDYLTIRKARKAPLTETALNGLQSQAEKAGISLAEALTICIDRNWIGFNAGWNWQNTPIGQKAAPNANTNADGISEQHYSDVSLADVSEEDLHVPF